MQTELTLAAPPEEPVVSRKVVIWTVITIVVLVLGLIVPVVGLRHFEKLARIKKPARRCNLPSLVPGRRWIPGFSSFAGKGAGRRGIYAVGTVVNSSTRPRSGVTVELTSGRERTKRRRRQGLSADAGGWGEMES